MQRIVYHTNEQIDKVKWDNCIDTAPNGLVYAYSFYLDTMAKNWDALILGDYESVMPLTWNRKYGIYYLYQPAFTACLGIFGKQLNAETIEAFLQMIPKKFSYWDICLNQGNVFSLSNYTLRQRINYVLNLNETVENLQNKFRENIKRNIKKSERILLTVIKNIPLTDVVNLVKTVSRKYATEEESDYNNFLNLCSILYKQKKAVSYGVFNREGTLYAAAVFLFSHNRAYYILAGNHPDGKTLGASHALINAFVSDHAGQPLVLDFEGSDVASLAFFYSSFGAVEERYAAILLNKLPVPIKWLKKRSI